MKVLLVQPPIEDFYDTDIRLQPIGLAYLKAAAKRAFPDLDIKVIDFHHGWGRRTKAWPKDLKYLKPFYGVDDRSPFSSFHRYFRFGAENEEIAEVFRAERPDIVGISSLFTPYYREALQVAQAAKACGAATVLGGSHVSADPQGILAHPSVDFVIRGEGERPFVEFLRKWKERGGFEHVANLGYKLDGDAKFNGLADNFSINDLPIPDLEDLQPKKYTAGRKPLTFMVTSRSCPHRCSFCSVHTTFGTSYRRRSLEDILAEIRVRVRQGYRVIDFEDDNLTFFKPQMKELCRRLSEEFMGVGLEFTAMNGISYLSLDEELLRLMRSAGFTRLNLALVSSDVSVLETSSRPHTVEKYKAVVAQAHQLGFQITSYQILGLPFEPLASMIRTLSLAAREPVLLGASLFYRTPASPIAKQCRVEEGGDAHFLARLTAMAVPSEHFERGDLYTLFITTRILNFFKANDIDGRRDMKTESAKAILRRLVEEGVLYATTPTGLRPLPEFRADLFRRVCMEVESLRTLDGRSIPLKQLTGGAAFL